MRIPLRRDEFPYQHVTLYEYLDIRLNHLPDKNRCADWMVCVIKHGFVPKVHQRQMALQGNHLLRHPIL